MGIHDDETIIAKKSGKTPKPKTLKKKKKAATVVYTLETTLRKMPYKLDKRSKLTIGRGSSCRIRIKEKTISELNSSIKWEKGSFRLKDEKSTNGTRLNGKDISRVVKLSDGDKIKIGRNVLVFKKVSGKI